MFGFINILTLPELLIAQNIITEKRKQQYIATSTKKRRIYICCTAAQLFIKFKFHQKLNESTSFEKHSWYVRRV